MAGRVAFNMGRWHTPCTMPTEHWHMIFTEDPTMPVVELCDFHYMEVEAQGLITNPVPTADQEAVAKVIAREQGWR